MTTEEIENKEEDTQIYEVGFHIIPMVPEEGVPAVVTELKDGIQGHGGVVIAEEFPRFRPLVYTVRKAIGGKYNKFNSAYFGWVKFEAPTAGARAIDKFFSGHEKILRSILIKTVRENTMAPQKAFVPRDAKTVAKAPGVGSLKRPEDKAPVSEEELDKTIAELVVE